MNMTNRIKRMLSMLLVFVLVFSVVPLQSFAAEDPIVLIAGGDYQQAGDHSNSASNVTNILDTITSAGFTAVDGFLFVGDYDCETHDSSSETSAGITSLMNTMSGVYGNLNDSNSILVQGNHDYPDSRIDASGGHTFSGYSVFVMNEDDYPNGGGSSSQAQTLSGKLESFLEAKLSEGYTAPIFVTSHVPLHFGPRTNRQGDGKYASYYFDVLNAYGAEGLNIIFMHGHNHAYGYDEYLGGEAIFLAPGDQINIAQTGSQSSYDTHTLNFTYMNAGYTGYYNESGYSTSSGTDFLTMTTFRIYDDRVVINRFNENGLYNMKTAGEKKGDYISSVSVSANTTVYASAQTVNLNAPAERITLEDSATGVTVTGLKVEGTFDDASDLQVSAVTGISVLDNSAKCSAYQAYSLTFAASGSVKVTLPMPSSYPTANTKVYQVKDNALTAVEATIADGTASFTSAEGGTYAVVREVSTVSSGSAYYERVDSVSQLQSGEKYLIVFDCSSQTTADAFVIPEIATYSSGSSKRMGPDVVVSDGIGDNATITGSYDNYLWTLTQSGSGWLIGNGSQNINVTYSSTTSRCELDFTDSGEALTIAAVSSNPSDADSCSFAVYDSSNYYWQYNTTATLIYGTSGDSYTSRFCFYKRVEPTVTDTVIPNGWIAMGADGTYTLDTDGIETGASNKYIVVGSSNDYALSLSGSTVGRTAVTVSGDTLTVSDPSACEFYFVDNSSAESGSYLLTQDGAKSIYHSGGNMYYGSDNKGYWHVGSASGGSYQLYDYDNLNWYLNYGYVWGSESVSRFAVSSTARTVRLFKTSDIYVRLAGETSQTVSPADGATEETVLGKLSIQTTEDGYVITDTIAVTADMVIWDPAFNGSLAGTYTGTVTYNNVELGSFTVTVAGHDYQTVTVEPTCTEAGSVTNTCTICGDTVVEEIPALGHTYESVTNEATCGKDGTVVHTCSVCAHSYTETLAATGNHSYEAAILNPTCTASGYTTYTCSVCAHSYTAEETAALGHNYESAVVDPTCTEDGSVTYYCEACGDIYSEVLSSTGHNYQTVVTAATCETDGYTTHTCAGCGDSYVTDTVAALGHSYETVTVEATCLTGGYTSDTCVNCGNSTVYNETAALGHNYTSVTVEPTETEGGYTSHTCLTCGHNYIDNVVDALGHSYVTVVTEATCETDGYTTHTCTVCGDVIVDSYVSALGHNYETVTVEATCTTDGSTSSTCTNCGKIDYQVLAAYGHDYTAAVTAATCTTEGHTVYTCGRCGDSYTGDVTAALGHSHKTITVEATCTEAGSVTEICENCGESHVVITTDALGHSYQTITVEATCTEDGSITEVCGNCGDSTTQVLAATGHSHSAAVTEATCLTEGYTTYTCACGDSYVDDYTVALGHSYSCVESDGYLVYTCDACRDSYSEEIVSALTYTRVSSISSGNAYVITLYSGSKYYALSHEGNEISLVQVTVSNNQVTSDITEDLVWNYSSNKLSYEDNGTTYYLYAKSSGWFGWTRTLALSTSSSSSVSFSSSKLKVGSYYLRYSSGNVTLNRSATTTYLFIEE